jgi:hypothetical protein
VVEVIARPGSTIHIRTPVVSLLRSMSRFMAIAVSVTLSMGLPTTTVAAQDARTTDPRTSLKGGVKNAQQAIKHLELVSSTPKADGWFNPDDLGDFALANSDLAFQKQIVFQGGWHGWQAWDISDPKAPTRRAAVVCQGGQGDPSVFGNLLFMSVEDGSGRLDCGAQGAGTIDGVVFANYGQPTGFCNKLQAAPACSKDVSAVVAAACVGKSSCTLLSSDETFGTAPCANSRLAVEVTCSNKAVRTFTSWNFTLLDEGMLDFLQAADSGSRTSIPNFSTIPNWLFTGADRTYIPDDPLAITGSYESASTQLVDATAEAVGDYYGRLVAHYVEGGFVDEAGRWIPGST